MDILVTGAQGTLGIPLMQELEKRQHSVVGIDVEHHHASNMVRCDVRNYRQLEGVFKRFTPKFVYHFAAEFGRNNGEEFYEQLWSTNQIGTENIIRLCREHGTKMILAGSSEAYGDSGQPDCKEDALDSRINRFHNNYALSKWVQERQVMIAAKNHGLNAVILRFFNAYGVGEHYSNYRSVVCLFCYRLLHRMPITVYRNGHRDFMYIDDWSRTVANVAEKFDKLPRGSNFAGVPVYNVGGDEYRNVEEMARIVAKEVGLSDQEITTLIQFKDTEPANVANKRPNLDLARRDLDHKTIVSLEEGVKRTVAWMEQVYGEKTHSRAVMAL